MTIGGLDGDELEVEIARIRRADWRFLLPVRMPQRAAHIGTTRSGTQASLAAVCATVVVLDPASGGQLVGATGFELVTVENPSPGSLQLAKSVLLPNGVMYCEIDRRRLRGPRSWKFDDLAADCVADMEALGLTEAAGYWHFPDFERCRCIIPLDDLAAGIRYLRRGNDRVILRAFGIALALPWVPKLVRRLLPCVSIVAREPGRARIAS